MKINRHVKAALLALVGLALAGSTIRTPASVLTNSILFDFPTGGSATPFANSGSVASWNYWYGIYGNVHITNDVTMDAGGDTNSGSLLISIPFSTNGNQQTFFGSFENYYAYDFNETANGLNFTNITFDIHVAPGTPLNAQGNFGAIGVGFYQTGTIGSYVTIPASATNGWVHLTKNIDYTQAGINNVAAFLFNYNSYSGYPKFPITFWIDNVALNLNAGPPPPPPTLGRLQTPVLGLNCIAASGQYDRSQLATVNDTGYSFVGQQSVTYSWTISSFPTNTGGNFQQHFFLVNGAPGAFDQAADYNLAQCIFVTVQQNNAGVATCNFRYKTNEPNGNAMLFNNVSPTNAANTNGWPIMPIASLTSSNGAIGTWHLTFSQSTNVTITAPSGASTNFVFDPAAAALFADPVTILLGGQPNNPNGYGQAVVYSNFSVTGSGTPFSDNFATDAAMNTNIWKNLSNNTNGAIVVPPGSAYWVSWSLPDAGFNLQTVGNLPANNSWIPVTSVPVLQVNGIKEALIATTNLPNASHSYFSMVKHVFSQLQVLLPGETAAPNTPTGKTGTPLPQNTTDPMTITVNAVDAQWNPVSGVTDTVTITSSDPNAVLPNNAALVNGTKTFQMLMGTPGNQTITATDVTDGTKTANTSTSFSVTP